MSFMLFIICLYWTDLIDFLLLCFLYALWLKKVDLLSRKDPSLERLFRCRSPPISAALLWNTKSRDRADSTLWVRCSERERYDPRVLLIFPPNKQTHVVGVQLPFCSTSVAPAPLLLSHSSLSLSLWSPPPQFPLFSLIPNPLCFSNSSIRFPPPLFRSHPVSPSATLITFIQHITDY